jgi:CelD/BcsL family acetyltransferase involved in cellulose biosynthesis
VAASTGSFVVEIVTRRPELERLADDWRPLAVAAGNPFLTPEWYFSYLDHTAEAHPFAVVVREGAELLLLLTLVREGGMLRFAGGRLGDCFRPLLAAGTGAQVLGTGLACLAEASSEWRLACFDRVEAEDLGPLASALKRAGANVATTGLDALPTVDLTGRTWDGYLAERSRNFRSELGRKERGLARDYGLEYVEEGAAGDVQTALTHHFDLHERRWPVRAGERAEAEATRVQMFHRQFAEESARRGWLRLWQLRADGRAIASWYGWKLGDRYSYYQAGLDPDWSRFSPGTLLLGRTIRAAIDERCATYDFLLGEEQYKRRFSSNGRDVTTLTAAPRPSLRVAVAAGAWVARKRVQELPPPVKRALRRAARVGR